jgi:hypothetical protein
MAASAWPERRRQRSCLLSANVSRRGSGNHCECCALSGPSGHHRVGDDRLRQKAVSRRSRSGHVRDLGQALHRLCPFYDHKWELLNGFAPGKPADPADPFMPTTYRDKRIDESVGCRTHRHLRLDLPGCRRSDGARRSQEPLSHPWDERVRPHRLSPERNRSPSGKRSRL